MKANKLFLTVVFVTACIQMLAQPGRWQQRANYTMHIDMDVQTNRFTGKQRIEYFNNSPDKLNRLFYHLYFNAFQPGSSMDVRSRELGKTLFNNRPDWDTRVKDRISKLKDDEIGYQKIKSLKVNGVAQPFKYHETILEVNLKNAILPKSKVIIDLEFEAQIPLQIRRSGRDNPSTGVQYSMSQWYPKLCEYDYEGWHPTPYVAREFYGVWGNFDVHISIDKNYKLGGTGVLVNAAEIGWGYDKPGTALKNISAAKRNWHFVGKNIHDFVWAADTAYNHLTKKVNNRVTLHVIYKYKPDNAAYEQGWQQVMVAAEKVLPYIEKHFGQYPYPQYSFIHGGDGGMEYPMATLIHTSSLGTAFHEWMHSWYQMMLGTNESLYPWMDEGFTSYAEDLVTKFYTGKSSLQPLRDSLAKYPGNENYQRLVNTLPEDHTGAYNGYYRLVQSGLEEPLTTHADHYNTNFAYSIASYSKGEMFLEQLGYIVGAAVRNKILLEYYKQWRFKHPNANDFMVIAQQVSGLQMDWYKEYWINTTKTIDYGIGDVSSDSGKTTIVLQRIGEMPMPVDLEVTYKDGSKEMHNVPLNLMYGAKKNENAGEKYFVHEEWRWTHPEYKLTINAGLNFIKKIEIDPSKRMADINRSNNIKEQ
ncbi:MAG: M1 family metallopeptidase [Chitinophagaceae bacterium]|nr:M1 family metallopeptidase [Chitinophagaceae bacterium]